MKDIKILAETPDAVTLSRHDFEVLLRLAEDAEDLAAVFNERAADLHAGPARAKELAYTGDEAERLLDGESPVRIWRERRGLSQRALAKAAATPASYLSAIETGQKPGSVAVLKTLAEVLAVPMDFLVE